MKVLVCNTHRFKGGAAKAANRISKSFSLNSVENDFFSLENNNNFLFKKTKFISSRSEKIQKLFSSKDLQTPFSSSMYSFGFKKLLYDLNPDIVNLHYVNSGFLSIKDIGLIQKPLVWTLHDSWAFTGGCHLSLDCQKYFEKCGNCPILRMNKENDLSRKIWNMKNENWKNLNLTIISPSRWLADCARKSSLFGNFRIETIPNPLDTDIFTKLSRNIVREELGLEKEKKYILFGAVDFLKDENKGFAFLKAVLKDIKIENVELVVFGSKEDEKIEVGIPVKNFGFVRDESFLAKIYSACNVTVLPSISENFPNIAIESISCGTPVVGFDIGGLREIVLNGDFGSLAKCFDIDDLQIKIEDLLKKEIDRVSISKYVEKNFNFLNVGKQYIEVFDSLIKKH